MTLRTKPKKGGYSICYKCLQITPEVFAAQIQQRRKEREELLMPRKAKSVEEELDDLDLDDLDDIEDEVEDDEDEDDLEDDDDPDEAPKARRKSRKAKAKPAAKKEKVGIGTQELADEAGVEPRVLRAFLRSGEFQPREEREGRYNWPSLRDPEAREIIKAVKGGAAARENKAATAELKKPPAKKKAATKSRTTKARAKK